MRRSAACASVYVHYYCLYIVVGHACSDHDYKYKIKAGMQCGRDAGRIIALARAFIASSKLS